MPTVKIKGMSCQHCVGSVKKALEGINGIDTVSVDLQSGEATYKGEVEAEVINQAIASIGFEVVND